MKKRWIFIGVLAVMLGICLFQIMQSHGNTSRVRRDIGESASYAREDLEAAMDAVEAYFQKNFEGCVLLEISYDEAFSNERSEGMAEERGMDSVITFTSSFYVNPNGGDGSLNPGDTYRNWQWIFGKTDTGKWEHIDHGYG